MGFQHVTTLKAAFLAISIYDKIDVRNTYALHGILYRLPVLSLKKTSIVVLICRVFIPIWLGACFLGITFVALNTALRGDVLRHQIEISKPKLIIKSLIYPT